MFNNKLYFQASDGTNGQELWQYNGSSDPSMVFDINTSGNSSPSNLTVFNNKLYFRASDGTNGYELYVYTPPLPNIITFTNPGTKTYSDASFNLGASADSNLTVSYNSSNAAICTVNAGGDIT